MIKPIAIYLPQYHSIPENDKAWGKGFTEWANVKKAQPLFEGHYQPHIPLELVGYYDLNDPKVLVKQAAMAKEYGIYGFCFYHYWFNGKKLLHTPVDNYLNSNQSDFPYCLCWANENWTRRWDGLDNEIIIAQHHSVQDDLAFILDKIPFFKDKRYIRINDKPILLVYRTELIPDVKKTAEIWRTAMREMGIGEIYLIRIESFTADLNPADINFDAAVEFTPDWRNNGDICFPQKIENIEAPYARDYSDTVLKTLCKDIAGYKLFRGVFPGWDNTPRRGSSGNVYINNTLEMFEFYLQHIVNFTRKHNKDEEQFIFINAWNEWGEGCHIEPDKKNQFKYLEICKRVINNVAENPIAEKLLDIYQKQIQTNEEITSLTKRIDRILNSKSYKIGNLITMPFRTLKGLFQRLIKTKNA